MDLCRPCGFGRYQPEEGRFTCRLCGVGLTTRTKVRARCNNFQMEVQYWSLVYAAVSTMGFYLWNAERIVNDSLTSRRRRLTSPSAVRSAATATGWAPTETARSALSAHTEPRVSTWRARGVRMGSPRPGEKTFSSLLIFLSPISENYCPVLF